MAHLQALRMSKRLGVEAVTRGTCLGPFWTVCFLHVLCAASIVGLPGEPVHAAGTGGQSVLFYLMSCARDVLRI